MNENIKDGMLKKRETNMRARSPATLKKLLTLIRIGPLMILLLIIVIFALYIDLRSLSSSGRIIFLSARNISNVLTQSATVSILAVGMLLVIVTAGIDLSVGSLMAISSVVGAYWWSAVVLNPLSNWNDGLFSTLLFILIVLAVGAGFGFINGFAFVKGRMAHPFIPTLTMLFVGRGLAFLFSNEGGAYVGVPAFVGKLDDWAILVVALLVIAVHFFLKQVTWGRWIYAVGGNPDSARRVGIKVDGVLISVYVFSGLCAALAALVGVLGRTHSGFPNAGLNFELRAIAAVIIGGASFFGGRGNVINALIGALIIAIIQNGLNLLNVQSHWELVVTGLIIMVAVELDVVRNVIEKRLQSLQAPSDETGFEA